MAIAEEGHAHRPVQFLVVLDGKASTFYERFSCPVTGTLRGAHSLLSLFSGFQTRGKRFLSENVPRPAFQEYRNNVMSPEKRDE